MSAEATVSLISDINREPRRELDRGVVGGAIISTVIIGLGILFGSNSLAFFSPSSFLLVVGGVIAAALINFSIQDLRRAWSEVKGVMFSSDHYPLDRISYFVILAQLVRREGILALDSEARNQSDSFLQLGLELAVDGHPLDEIRRVLDNEIRASNEKQARAILVFQGMAAYAPAMGLIGTIIGLIQMLNVLSDPTQIGPAMSLALLTTLYGAILANLVLLPIAGKLRLRAEEETLVKNITVEGLINLTKQESPIVMEQKLQSFLT